MIYVELRDQQNNEIVNFNVPEAPYVTGQLINVSVENLDCETWDVENIYKSFFITNVEHGVRMTYVKECKVVQYLTLTVKEIEKE